MEESELEEGEISDSGDEAEEIKLTTSSSVRGQNHSPLPRPSNPVLNYREPVASAHTFRDQEGARAVDSGSDNSDDGSDDEGVGGKRARTDTSQQPQPDKHKKRNVWADVLLEQQISSKIKSSGRIVTDDTDTIERGVESYRPSGERRTVDPATLPEEGEVEQGEIWDVNDDGESGNAAQKNSIHDRLDYEYCYDNADGYENYEKLESLPEEVTAEDDERVIARYIARNLQEAKVVLMERVIRYAGKEKSLELYHATQDVESAGGMMTQSGVTRRTPGGVFLQLLKKDKNISKQTVKDIFAVERENQKFAKKVLIKDRQMRKRKYYNKQSKTETPSAEQMESSAAGEEFELMEEPDIQIGES